MDKYNLISSEEVMPYRDIIVESGIICYRDLDGNMLVSNKLYDLEVIAKPEGNLKALIIHNG